MKMIKKFMAVMLALMLVLCACACSQSDVDTDNENPTSTPSGSSNVTPPSSSGTQIPDGMVQYKVKVMDDEGNPIAGLMVQLCTEETCLAPVKTDETGVAAFAPAEEGEYHANFLPGVPAGYEADAEVFYFEDGETEMTIVLKVVAG